jgi:hypothetical protein
MIDKFLLLTRAYFEAEGQNFPTKYTESVSKGGQRFKTNKDQQAVKGFNNIKLG